MATKHWIRDAKFTAAQGAPAGNQTKVNAAMFHFLRVAGFDWLWECGNENHTVNPNFVPDGDMEDPTNPPTYWTATGAASIQKVTSPVRSGTRALEVDPTSGGGVRSDDLALAAAPATTTGVTGSSLTGPDAQGRMTFSQTGTIGADNDSIGREFEMSGSVQGGNNGRFPIIAWPSGSDNQIVFYNPNGVAESYTTTTYEVAVALRIPWVVVMYVSNTGPSINVNIDRGNGTPVTVGTIPNNGGVSTKYVFSFTAQGSGPYYVYVENPSTGPAFYIDSMTVFRSMFEYFLARDEAVSGADPGHYAFTNNLATNHYGVDGVLTNPDQFSTGAGDNYSPGPNDVGKDLVIWDPTNNKNSGIYKIIADLGGGAVQVDMRSGSAAFTSVPGGGLKWRIINFDQYQVGTGSHVLSDFEMPEWQQSAGFGIESPHTSSWRFFLRQNTNSGANVKNSQMWAAPEDTDFNQSTGNFFLTGPSTQRYRGGEWSRNISGGGLTPGMHTWRGEYRTSTNSVTRLFLMTDVNLSFFTMWNYADDGAGHDGFIVGYLGTDTYHPGIMEFALIAKWEVTSQSDPWDGTEGEDSFTHGTGFNSTDLSCRTAIVQYGYDNSSASPQSQSNAGPNPFSNNEWMHPVMVFNDPFGSEGSPSEREMDIGMYQGRRNMTNKTAFDSNNYLHLENGYIWEWSGESILA